MPFDSIDNVHQDVVDLDTGAAGLAGKLCFYRCKSQKSG